MENGVVNWGDHTVEEETNHALMAISSNSEVSLCSKTCTDSDNKLKVMCDEQTNLLDEQEAKLLSYSQAVKKLESQIVTFQKQQFSLNENLTFQANAIYEKDEKLKKYRRNRMKSIKEKEQLQKTITSNNEVLSYEEEMNRTVFNSTEEDFIEKPVYNRFSKTDNLKGVPHPLNGDYTPKQQQEFDESLYVYGKKGPQKPETNVSNDKSSVYSTYQSNDSKGSIGNSAEHTIVFESETIIQLNAGRPNINFVRPNINTGRINVNSVRPNINTGRTDVNSVRPRVNTGSSNVNTVRSRQPVPTRTSNSFSPKRLQGNYGTTVKTSAGYNWRNSRPNSNYDSGPTFIRTDHPLKNMGDRGIFDSGCSWHITGNKDHLDDFEEFKGGSVTFGRSKGYITGKGRIKVGNLEFDTQIFDKQHKVLFTETECLVVTLDFKMPDEN
ncbi:hypothetical protein Tco_0626640 [Tanacetum coccineum]|uniref:Retrovirus-related Pol polyprotein from transposon TNT 1-94-like beta-barrel domain-containing protein n=1 Tax=Tanacetum coccineum TaxID=301880 RepID=A0ABQ4WK68_9ASTR